MMDEMNTSETFATPYNWHEADVDTLLSTSLRYSTGDGVELDYVMAHVWLNIAATLGSLEAREQRRQLAQEMTNEEIAKAQKIARELLHARNYLH